MRLPERGGLADQPAEPRMNDVEREAERAVAELGMRDAESAGREPRRQPQATGRELQEVARAAENQRARRSTST